MSRLANMTSPDHRRLTPAELMQLPHPPTPPKLTSEQGQELIRRLNQTAGELESAEEWEFLADQPTIRYAADVVRIRQLLEQVDDGSQFHRGVRAALDYTAGRLPVGPLTGEPPEQIPPLHSDLGDEVSMAMDAFAGDLDEPLPHSRDYIVGVEHTCMWLRCSTNDAPVVASER